LNHDFPSSIGWLGQRDIQLPRMDCERIAFNYSRENQRCAFFDCLDGAINLDISSRRRFVRIGYACEFFDLASKRFFVKALHIALDQDRKRTANIDFDKSRAVTFYGAAYIIARLPVRRDGRGERYHAIARQQSRDETYATDIRIAVFSRKSKPATQALAHFISVEYFNAESRSRKLTPERAGERRFPRA
jgi:hypothetical protein